MLHRFPANPPNNEFQCSRMSFCLFRKPTPNHPPPPTPQGIHWVWSAICQTLFMFSLNNLTQNKAIRGSCRRKTTDRWWKERPGPPRKHLNNLLPAILNGWYLLATTPEGSPLGENKSQRKVWWIGICRKRSEVLWRATRVSVVSFDEVHR